MLGTTKTTLTTESGERHWKEIGECGGHSVKGNRETFHNGVVLNKL